jgi:hypothetical protein
MMHYAVVETRPLVCGERYDSLGPDKRWHHGIVAMSKCEAEEIARLQNDTFGDWQPVQVMDADVAREAVGR